MGGTVLQIRMIQGNADWNRITSASVNPREFYDIQNMPWILRKMLHPTHMVIYFQNGA